MQEYEVYLPPSPILDPPISVILSTYNRWRKEGSCSSLLKRALDSIFHQTFSHFELILIDDHSNDGTKEYCKNLVLNESRLKFFSFHENSKLPAKRYNFGISVSLGKYISFMFDDDEWYPSALEDLYLAIQRKSSFGMIYGQVMLYRGGKRSILGGRWGARKIDSFNFISNNSVIIKREIFDWVGGYDEDPSFIRLCDWDLWWRIGRKFKVGRLKKCIGNVYSGLSDSIGMTQEFDLQTCKERQRKRGLLPLQKIQKERIRCKLRSFLFDYYVKIFPIYWIKNMARQFLPNPMYQFLKNIKNFFIGRSE